jgi:hypothetical protein
MNASAVDSAGFVVVVASTTNNLYGNYDFMSALAMVDESVHLRLSLFPNNRVLPRVEGARSDSIVDSGADADKRGFFHVIDMLPFVSKK